MAANILCVGYEDSKHDSREHEAGLRAPPLPKASLATEIRRDSRVKQRTWNMSEWRKLVIFGWVNQLK